MIRKNDTEVFRFKQFNVNHGKVAMKVNTDGVLLGAWAEVNGAETILDIGTGTGVIALMMAQRNTNALIDAIDIDESAYLQAKENFELSQWNLRLQVFHTALQNFFPDAKYDIVLSNPPYFIDDFKTGNRQKDIAKHSIALSYHELLSGINRLLSDKGKAYVVIPFFNYSAIQTIAAREGLFVSEVTEVMAIEGKKPYLVLLQLQRNEQPLSRTQMAIQQASGEFTAAYITLTKDFYLKF
ncbi:MAG: methyltransferase [Bacteroidota bacterium]